MPVTFADLVKSDHILLTTFTKDGRPKPTAIWAAPDGDRLVATTYVQRIATTGGLAPPAAECNAATAGTVAEVPYTADYYFWKKTERKTLAGVLLLGEAEGRTPAQVLADTLVERLTGQASAAATPVEVHLVMTDQALLDKTAADQKYAAEVLKVKRHESGIVLDPITIDPKMKVLDVIKLTQQHRISGLPVVENGTLAGIVSIGDVVKHRITDLQAERDQLSAYIQQ